MARYNPGEHWYTLQVASAQRSICRVESDEDWPHDDEAAWRAVAASHSGGAITIRCGFAFIPRTLLQARAEADQAKEEASVLAHAGSRQAHGSFLTGACTPSQSWECLPGEKAIDWQADLTVVGSHGRRALGRLLLGVA